MNTGLWNMGPLHKRVYARLRRPMRGDDPQGGDAEASANIEIQLTSLRMRSAAITNSSTV
jgi:hypothetical protein